MRDSVPSASYSSVCNVLRQWNIPLIPTYRVYRLYDRVYRLYDYIFAMYCTVLYYYINNLLTHVNRESPYLYLPACELLNDVITLTDIRQKIA